MVSIIQKIQDEDIAQAKKFSDAVVNETYNRFKKDISTRKERIFFGKLGEIIFLRFLNSRDIFPDVKSMFEVYDGETNVDKFDFITEDNKKIDVKSAYKEYHTRILIPYDQFEDNKAKDYYIGVKIDIEKKESCICGFTTREKLENNGKRDFGEYPAYWEFLDQLEDINELIQKIK